MSTAKPKWSRIKAPPLPRSSHSLSIINDKAYIFGGEINPREPVDSYIHIIDLITGEYEQVQPKGDIPEARVGHVAGVVNGEILIFGGRGGKEMQPLPPDIYIYTPLTRTFYRPLLASSSPSPQPRSYHSSTTTPSSMIIHGGCGPSGIRYTDTWEYTPSTSSWRQLPSSSGNGRGGSGITYHNGRVWKFGGFDGKSEQGGGIEYLVVDGHNGTPSESSDAVGGIEEGNGRVKGGGWKSIPYPIGVDGEGKGHGPGARSVHTLLPFGQRDEQVQGSRGGRLITCFGEGRPSPTGGHDSAGSFWGDIWVFDIEKEEWEEVEFEVNVGEDGVKAGRIGGLEVDGNGKVGERGWFASDRWGEGIVIWGGIDGDNQRLGDGWLLK